MPRIDLWVGPGLISAQASTGCAWSMTTPRLRTALVRESELPQARRHPPREGRHYAPVPKPRSLAQPCCRIRTSTRSRVRECRPPSGERQVRLGVTLFSSRAAPRLPTAKTRSHPLDRAESTVPARGRVVRLATCCRVVIGGGRRAWGGDTPRGPHRGWGPRVSVRR